MDSFLYFLTWKWSKSAKNVIFYTILTNFGTIWPTQKPLYYQRSTINGSCSHKILHRIVLPENVFISIFFEVKMIEKCQKCHISCNFEQFWDRMTHSNAPDTTNKVLKMAHILPYSIKYSIKYCDQKMDSFLSFLKWKWPKSAKMSYFMQFWPILGPYDPLKSPWYYQRSTLNGSYSPKILHKIVLPGNGFISIFFGVKMFEKCPKCHITCNFGTIWPTQKPLTPPTKYVTWLIFSQKTP